MNKDCFKEIVYNFNQSTNEALYLNIYSCNDDELQLRLDNLNIIYEVLKSNTGEEEKIKTIFSIYKDVNEFKSKYSFLIRYGAYDHRLDDAREALNNFDFIVNSLEKIPNSKIEIIMELEEKKYLDNYNDAEYVIKEYISNDKGYYKNMFLRWLGIDNNTFDYYVEVIRYVNPILYKEYRDTVKYYNERKELSIKEAIMDLYAKIKGGYFLNKTDLECLEFYQELPFKEYGNRCINVLKKFINDKMDNNELVYKIISDFLYDRKVNKILFANETKLAETSVSLRNVKLNPSIIHNVFRYIDVNDLPRIMPVYRTVLNEYVNGNLDFSNLDDLEERKREEMLLERERYGFKKNSYKLVRRK